MTYPFTAIVGMDDARLALTLNAVSPEIGGVLVRGEKGTAKSTMVRALATVLPEVTVVEGCRFSCDPRAPYPDCVDGPHPPDAARRTRPARLVELPVGATDDRVVGALDVERALTEGVKSYEPGLLAAAHRGLLYVDEVNLLHDHVVDLLLDAAALGMSYVERDGVSVRHPARFLLVGTMNPEEGELRPQLLDRFGLTVDVAAPRAAELRAEVVRRRIAYDADPAGFAARWEAAEAELAGRVAAARRRLPDVALPDAALRQITSVCAAFEVDGLRADLVTARTAVAHAAWAGRAAVTAEDVRVAARLALPHRRRRNPFDAPGLDEERLDEALAEAAARHKSGRVPEPNGDGDDDGGGGGAKNQDANPKERSARGESATERSAEEQGRQARAGEEYGADGYDVDGSSEHGEDRTENGADERADRSGRNGPNGGTGASTVPPGRTFAVRRLDVPGLGAGAAGRRSRAETDTGRTVGAAVPRHRLTRLHVAATLAAAAPHQHARGRRGPGGLVLRRTDLREARREGRESNLVLFVVDASGSMAARRRMGAVKGAVLSLLLDAYQRRDKVGLITFRGAAADTVLPPTSSVDVAAARLATLPTGGRTPLAAGLLRAREVLSRERLRDPRRRPLLVVVTDGRATGGDRPVETAFAAARLLAADEVASVVVDCESGVVRLGLAARLAEALGGLPLRLEDLAAEPLARSVRRYREVA